MGVKNLFKLVSSAKEIVSMKSMRGQRVAVDYGIWLMQFINSGNGSVNIHLEGTMIRLLRLMKEGVRVVIVLEKYDFSIPTRTITKELLDDVEQMLQVMKIPYITASNNAEECCSYLENNGFVDATISEDSDSLLYGSKRLYRNVFSKDGKIELYTAEKIESCIGLNRNELISLSFLLGSSETSGVKNIGCKAAIDIIKVVSQKRSS